MTKVKCADGSFEDVDQEELEAASEIFNQSKLKRLAELEGMSVDDLLQKNITDCVVPSICMNPNCDYSTGMEPDQREGWCEMCDAMTMCSCLVLAELI